MHFYAKCYKKYHYCSSRLAIPQHFPHVQIPLWGVMPDHIHGIVIIDDFVDAQNFAHPHDDNPNKFVPQSKNLASVIRGFKIGVTSFARKNNIQFAWQSRYYDRIIRDSAEMNRIAEYIENNVAEWDENKGIDLFGK